MVALHLPIPRKVATTTSVEMKSSYAFLYPPYEPKILAGVGGLCK